MRRPERVHWISTAATMAPLARSLPRCLATLRRKAVNLRG